ncbi:methylthioribose-1-phosphate isomerase [Thalassobacillus devorans]|uniref:Methylthioribose-1-phosphate isomerase n=1 Tax=Thalassobacillus devorans TaxID=279813 RepID=A0ABQ1NF51_9BACI|nr:S-methyl-5-thioribose-1-phosphate isomerase [Thalassobacillus devorans]NIK27144.1 methylthioribose-1-phosphate isomerase [Thalassobacillus devorans]GGC75297.1 methylthioribose-1-phosphate isomerase [Thalassobacillus devorans]
MRLIEELANRHRESELALPIWFENRTLRLLDQLKLPFEEDIQSIASIEELGEAIRSMMIRGSGAIGLCGAYGVYLAAYQSKGDVEKIRQAGDLLKSTRPTAVNLMKTVDEMVATAVSAQGDVVETLEQKAVEIIERQLEFEYQLGKYGAELIEDGDTIMTHCHSGALGGAGYGGRALSVIRAAHEQGKNIHVFTCETRPYLQGARITAYELKKFGIPHTLITDNMSGFCMNTGKIDKIVVGSDRVSANGDLANKVGTYMHALAAKENGIPFYTATSSHTIDFDTPSGDAIEVEMRNADEVTQIKGVRIAPEGTSALYPSFDITPNKLISGIITEKGVITAPFEQNLGRLNEKVNV